MNHPCAPFSFNLTPMQKGMLFHCLAVPQSGTDVEQVIGTLLEPVDLTAFRQAWQRLVDRHDVLRMRFVLDEKDIARQFPLDQVTLPINERDWSALPSQEQELSFETFLKEDRVRGFDPRVDLPIRVIVFRFSESEYRFVFTWWHGILDGRARFLLIQELFCFYESFRKGEDISLPSPRPYSDFAEWLNSRDMALSAPFWKGLLADFEEPTPVGTSRLPSKHDGTDFGFHEVRLSKSLTSRLQTAVNIYDVTMNTLVQGAWALVLNLYTGKDDVVFGSTRSCRHSALDGDGSGEGIIGLLINTVPVRVRLRTETRVLDFLRNLRKQHVDVRPHEHSALVAVQSFSGVPADRPLFNSIVVYENQLLDSALRSKGDKWTSRRFEIRGQSGYPLTVLAYGEPELLLGISNDRACIDDSSAERMLSYLVLAMQLLAEHPDKYLFDLPLLLDGERKLLEQWNLTECLFHADGSIQKCFEDQVARTPTAAALTFQGKTLTYRELDHRAEEIARKLRAAGAGPEVVVGICMERCLDLVAGMLGILKSGAAYLPLDPTYPLDRLKFMIEDARPLLVVTNQKTRELLSRQNLPILSVDEDACTSSLFGLSNHPGESRGGRCLAYVIYTSGSTGKPKGVMVEHRNVMNFFAGMDSILGTEPGVCVAVTSISFDPSVLDLFWTLTRGYHVILWPGIDAEGATSLPELISHYRATHIMTVPSLIQMVSSLPGGMDALALLRRIIVGGEPLAPALLRDLGPVISQRIVNAYGPTETTIISSLWEVDPGSASIPIGRPIANTQIFLLDSHLRPVPVGVVGELYIGGAGVARGYLNRPDLTAEKFLSNPFAATAGERLYRTGDLVRYRMDGLLEFVGRIDDQVKIRGFRVELGEIEAVLAKHPKLQAVVIDAQDADENGKRLVAYVVPGSGGMPPISELRQWVGQKLPRYMIPSIFVELAQIPLTANGKLDRRALPPPIVRNTRSGEERLSTHTEVKLAEIWCEVLGLSHVAPDENFFDLGGNSLLMTRVLVKLNTIGIDIPIMTMFKHPTIRSLSNHLNGEKKEEFIQKITISSSTTDIAIIGMSGRFPKARNINEYWCNLLEGTDCLSSFSDAELQSSGIDYKLLQNPNYVKIKGIVENIELFDAAFFGISPREAEVIDPQHRMFLECSWEALENAGYNPHNYEGSIGVFAGTGFSGYLTNNLLTQVPEETSALNHYQNALGNEKDHISTRVSYKLNLKGPSVSVQTACSTSLVNIVLACQSLLSHQCDMALAGGVSITVPHKAGYLYQEGLIFSPDGCCRAFDAKAQGTVRGEGCGVVILKRLTDAIADGDRIRAVIKGSAINNDGSSKVGYTAPSVDGQAEVIARAHAAARTKAETINYIETHGTGTPLGDPIEFAALTKAFRASTDKKNFCAIGSVKTNIGHLDAAAGVAGLIKTVMALENRQIPPSLHFEEAGPNINLEDSPFYVNTSLSEWTAIEGPRRAGVSSFGIGGTNAHVIVEEAPVGEESSSSRPWQLLMLSAKTDTALTAATENLTEHLKALPNQNLADTAFTLQVGRRRFGNRRVIVCQNTADAIQALETMDPRQVYTHTSESENRAMVFMFSGQGSQYVNMASELYRIEPTFRETVDYCSQVLQPLLRCDLRDIIYPDENMAEEAAERLKQTSITQPALFVIEFALTKLLAEWGIKPRAMIGHSVGEYVAACLAGVFTLEEALELVALRGRIIQELPDGAMLAVTLSEKETIPLLGKDLSLAAVNGPSLCVVSGTNEAVHRLTNALNKKGISCSQLHTSHAFHSEMMEPAIPFLTECISKINLLPPNIPYLSNVTGTWITAAEATDPAYWVRHFRQTVRFSQGIAELLAMPDAILIEVGPGQTLGTIVKRHPDKSANQLVLASLRHPKEQVSDVEFLLSTLGRLWLAGATIDWEGFYKNEQRHRVPLPTYPFERKRHWIEPVEKATVKESLQKPLNKKQDISDWFYVPSWTRSVRPTAIEYGEMLNQGQTWLVFVDECHINDNIVKKLKNERATVISVMPAEHFTQISGDVFAINPLAASDYKALFKALTDLNMVPERIVHSWGVTKDVKTSSKEIDEFEASNFSCFYSLLFLIQSIAEYNRNGLIQIDIITNGLHEVTGEEVLRPEKATMLGLCKVVPQEHPNIYARNIDVVIPDSWNGQESALLIENIWLELTSKLPEQIIAYRGRHRWVQAFDQIKVDFSAEKVQRKLNNSGVYLITGGLGYIGLTLAKFISQTVPAKIVLLGRSKFPPKDEWHQWIEAHGPHDKVSRKIRKVQEIERSGAETFIFDADVADLKRMQEIVEEIDSKHGGLNGIIHAAGIIGEKTLQALKDIDVNACATHFRPKIKGLRVLENVLQGRKLDFCLLTSSLSSVLGGLGFAAYSAANLFMDAYAIKYFANGTLPWVSINWDAWQPNEESAKKAFQSLSISKLAMTPEEGTEAFRYILSLEMIPTVVVSTGDLQARLSRRLVPKASANREITIDSKQSTNQSRPAVARAYVPPRNSVEQAIAEIWQETLGIESVGIYDDYFELGGDSLLAIEIMSRIAETFKIELPLHTLLEDRTVERFAQKLAIPYNVEMAIENKGVSRKIEIEGTVEATSEPQTVTERRLLSIWQHVLNRSDFGTRDSFHDLQGNSDLVDLMFARVKNEFGVFAEGLPINRMREKLTIEALAQMIEDTMKPTQTLVVDLQPLGSKRPLFLIHAGGGYVFFYRALAHQLGLDRPVYAVRAETVFDGKGRPFDQSKSIEELAARYIGEIKMIQPTGPYLLGGASFGGVTAFEMARQLQAQGEELAGPLLLFSAIVANNYRARAAGASPPTRLGQRVEFLRSQASALKPWEAISYISNKVVRAVPYEINRSVKAAHRRLRTTGSELLEKLQPVLPWKAEVPFEVKQQRVMKKFMEATSRLLYDYTPEVFNGSIVLFKSSNHSDLELWWTGLASSGMTVHTMPGGHLDMLEEPTVAETAALISKYLDEGENNTFKPNNARLQSVENAPGLSSDSAAIRNNMPTHSDGSNENKSVYFPEITIPTLESLSRLTDIWEQAMLHRCINVAARLGIADLLVDGGQTIENLAEQTGSHAPTLYRVMRFLSSHGIFGEAHNGMFTLSPISECLRSDVRWSLRWGSVVNDCHELAGPELLRSVRTGECPLNMAIGMDFWTYLGNNPEANKWFDLEMQAHNFTLNIPALLSLEWDHAKVVVDVAGGTGQALGSILHAHPHLRGILVDQPQVMDRAREVMKSVGVETRCKLEPGNIFKAVPAGADTYILARVLHDWDDNSAVEILKVIRRAISNEGRLLILEMVVPAGNQKHISKAADISMLLLFGGGRERTEDEFAKLLRAADFQLSRIEKGRGVASFIIATPG